MTDYTTHPLYSVLMAAIDQCTRGKGTRHGGDSVPFLDQPMFHYIKMHGRGFATGQAAKKLEEAASTRSGAAFETEVLGAIVYAASAILAERQREEAEKKATMSVPQPREFNPNGSKKARRSIDDVTPEEWQAIKRAEY